LVPQSGVGDALPAPKVAPFPAVPSLWACPGRAPDFSCLNMNAVIDSFSQDSVAAPTIAWVREGRWRKARDAAKDLCKKDRPRYLPLLIEANVGLFREMLGKGLAKDASSVVDYLVTIAPAERIVALRSELLAPVVKSKMVDPASSDAHLWWDTAERLNGSGGAISELEFAEIDRLVTDTFSPNLGQESSLTTELMAVRAACVATGNGNWDEARDLLRDLPRLSIFRHWRMFLRGVRSYYQDDWDTARQCFQSLPVAGALARAARVLDPRLAPPGPLAAMTARVPFYLAISGQKTTWAAPLINVATTWKAGERVEAFSKFIIEFKAEFQSERPGLVDMLLDGMLPYCQIMSETMQDESDELVHRLRNYTTSKARSSAAIFLTSMRPFAVASCLDVSPSVSTKTWNHLLYFWNILEGPQPIRDSVAWHWLGKLFHQLSIEYNPWDSFDYDETREDPDELLKYAREYLEKSVTSDPSHEAAWLSLLSVLVEEEDTKAVNRMLDDLTKRFPQNTKILIQAGMQAWERAAYPKSLGFLTTALALEPMNRKIKFMILSVVNSQVLERIKKKQSTANCWAKIEPLLEDRPEREHCSMARWVARTRRGIMDQDAEAAAQARAEALVSAPSVIERLLCEGMVFIELGSAPKAKWVSQWNEALKTERISWESWDRLLVMPFSLISSQKSKSAILDKWLIKYLPAAFATLLGDGLQSDPAAMLNFVTRYPLLMRSFPPPLNRLLISCMNSLSEALENVVKSSSKSPVDPHLRMSQLLLMESGFRSYRYSENQVVLLLDRVIEDAKAQGLSKLLELAEAKRQSDKSNDHKSSQSAPPTSGWADDFFPR
jgi:hypothetical protein